MRSAEVTNPNYVDIMRDGKTYITESRHMECPHKNGWYVMVQMWIFKKRVFVCSDCGAPLEVT